MSFINIDLPIALLYHHSKILEGISIRMGTGTFSSTYHSSPLNPSIHIIQNSTTSHLETPPIPTRDSKPCPSCLFAPRQDLCTLCRRNWLQSIEQPIPYQRMQHLFLAIMHFTCGWVILIGNMVNEWWSPGPFFSKLLYLISPLLPPPLLSSPPSFPFTVLMNILGWISALITFLTLLLFVLGYMLEYSWTKTRLQEARERPRVRRFRRQRNKDICCPGLCVLLHMVGLGVQMYVTLLCCTEQENRLVMLPWQLGWHHLVMLAFKRLERKEIVDLESDGGDIEVEGGLAKGA
ncbi:hypothetical protein ONS95_013861 [Cadophora gregata]|uniref:uncharacterized protein n=1 Tax=Cadophora gregata TaxID=51156 RepID=UPI0026DB8490|nr:uncharacterized protein ONS95_013861 [Cadophora gregata]KAK0114369.1 hypothetical protein ONS95_013861 [Cadophora gregata]